MRDRDTELAEIAAEVLPVIESAGAPEPFTSSEVADELGCARTTAYKKLQQLSDADILETKKAGARARVWWLTQDGRDRASDHHPDDDREEYPPVERQSHAVFEAAFDAMLIADDQGRYVEVNPAACELFGLPEDELIGRTVAEFAAEGYDVEKAWSDFQRSDLDRGLFPLVRADGEHRIVEFAATPNILPGRHLSVLRDVTERREAKEELSAERERSRQYQRTLAADVVIELEIRIDDDAFPFNELSRTLGCTVSFEGMVPRADDEFLHYIVVGGAGPGTVHEWVAAAPLVRSHRVVSESDTGTLLELVLDHSPVQTLVEAGARGRSMDSVQGTTTVVAEVGADANIQYLINQFTTAYPDATVVAKRTLNHPLVTTALYRDSLVDSMTDRQTEVLRAAYLGGYYEWPRNSKAEEMASSMGIAASTWLRHLRLAEAALVGWFFEELDA